jgi:hypothetical protein
MNAIVRSELLTNLENEALNQMTTFLGAVKSRRGLLTSLAVLVAISVVKALDSVTEDITQLRYNTDRMVDQIQNIALSIPSGR